MGNTYRTRSAAARADRLAGQAVFLREIVGDAEVVHVAGDGGGVPTARRLIFCAADEIALHRASATSSARRRCCRSRSWRHRAAAAPTRRGRAPAGRGRRCDIRCGSAGGTPRCGPGWAARCRRDRARLRAKPDECVARRRIRARHARRRHHAGAHFDARWLPTRRPVRRHHRSSARRRPAATAPRWRCCALWHVRQ